MDGHSERLLHSIPIFRLSGIPVSFGFCRIVTAAWDEQNLSGTEVFLLEEVTRQSDMTALAE